VQRHQDERHPAGQKAHRVRRSDELPPQCIGADLIQPLLRHDQFARQSGRLEPALIEQKSHPLAVSCIAHGDIGHQDAPFVTEPLEQIPQRP